MLKISTPHFLPRSTRSVPKGSMITMVLRIGVSPFSTLVNRSLALSGVSQKTSDKSADEREQHYQYKCFHTSDLVKGKYLKAATVLSLVSSAIIYSVAELLKIPYLCSQCR